MTGKPPAGVRPLQAWGPNVPVKAAETNRHEGGPQAVQLDRDQTFSWARCVVSLLSYALLLTDVIRSGVGIRSLGPEYPPLHPDVFVSFGPYAYPIIHLTTANATSDATSDFWPYKYDTTSLAMRSVAQHFQLPTWPRCVLYKERCVETLGLPLDTVFTMIDAVVEAVANHIFDQHGSSRPRFRGSHLGHLTLRTESEYKDRLHHYALPWFFERTTKRTTQAIHYTHQRLANEPSSGRSSRNICANTRPRPLSCDELWTKYAFGFCGRSPYPPCEKTIWTDIPERLDVLMDTYPNHTIDFIVLDSMEDYTRGSLAFQGRKYFDFVTLARVRQCDSGEPVACTTIAVDDYRYESASFTMDAPSWFLLVASLRAVGQVYMWLRVLLLFGGCFAISATSQRRRLSLARRIVSSVRTLFLIPSQIVVYGSTAPIVIYVVAHLIDSPAVYELVTTHFDSFLGDIHINVSDFVRQCSVSMRTVWILGLTCQAALAIGTHCSWSPTNGVLGIPEFSISVVAAATIFAQYRSLQFRSTRVFDTVEVVPSSRHVQCLSNTYDRVHGTLNNYFGGSPIDLQCLSCIFLGLSAVTGVSWLLNRVFPRCCPYRISLLTRTLVPYSASLFWQRSRLVVSWFGPIFMQRTSSTPAFRRAFTNSKTYRTPLRDTMFTSFLRSRRLPRKLQVMTGTPLSINDSDSSSLLQRDMLSVDKRSREVEALLMLVNLAVMTDPLTFLNLRVFSGHQVGVYESRLTRRRYLLPLELHRSDVDIPLDWTELQLVDVVDSRDLGWRDLLSCG